jgi:tRNA G18 (ribose-2'-O)-methylase SpoU
MEDGRYRLRSILVNEAALRDLHPLVGGLDPGVPVYLCGNGDFQGITGFHIHRGCLALVERPAPQSIVDVLAGAGTVVVLEGVANADNVGGVFRNAAAFGAAVILTPTACDPLYRKAIRTSMGAVLTVPFARADEWPAALTGIRDAGFTLAALTPREPSVPLAEWRPGRARIALLVGAEGAGLSAEAASRADVRVRIPTTGAVDSLNLAVAVGIALFALRAG